MVNAATSLYLSYAPPYDWDAMLAFLGARAIPGVEIVSRRRYTRTIAIGDAGGVLSVEPPAAHRVHWRVRFPDPGALPAIVARVRRMLDLTAEPRVISAHLALDPRLAPLVGARPGLRVPGAWDGFELAVRAVLGQQITVRGATTLAGRLVRAFGTAVADDDGLTHLFPPPDALVDADVASIGLPRTRAATIRALATAVAQGVLPLDVSSGLDDA